MAKSKFVNGDVIRHQSEKFSSGKTRTGVIADGFYWKDSDDGSMNEPKTGFLPVAWDDGTQGYRHEGELEYA